MERDEARAILLKAFVTMPDLPDELRATMAALIDSPVKRNILGLKIKPKKAKRK